MVFIGLDPGLSGAWAVIDNNGDFVACGDVPVHEKLIVTRTLWRDLSLAIDGQDIGGICCENVGAMPGQGVTSMFNFGRATGQIYAVAERFLAPWHIVRPQDWKKQAGLIGKDKDQSRLEARVWWPEAAEFLKLKKHQGRADALWLAEFARNLEN